MEYKIEYKPKQKVYLAGPMKDSVRDTKWRDILKANFGHRFYFLDPYDFEISGSAPSVIVNTDKQMIRQSDFVIANITQLSIGTSMEILYAYMKEIPVFLINSYTEEAPSPWHIHHSTKIFDSFDDLCNNLAEMCQK